MTKSKETRLDWSADQATRLPFTADLWEFEEEPLIGSIEERPLLFIKAHQTVSFPAVAHLVNWEIQFDLIAGLNEVVNRSELILGDEEGSDHIIFGEDFVAYNRDGKNRRDEGEQRVFYNFKPSQIYPIRLVQTRNRLRVFIFEQSVLLVEGLPSTLFERLTLKNKAQGKASEYEKLIAIDEIVLIPYSAQRTEERLDIDQKYDRWSVQSVVDHRDLGALLRRYEDINLISRQPSEEDLRAPAYKAMQFIPLLTEKYDQFHGHSFNGIPIKRKFVDGTINPGPIPPNFVHAWALNCKNIKRFRPNFKEVLLDGDDVIKFFTRWSFVQQDSKGDYVFPVPIAYWRVKDVKSHWFVDLTNHGEDIQVNWGNSNLSYTRLYIQLETSSKKMDRRFLMDGLELEGAVHGDEACYRVGDNLRYDSSQGQIIEASKNKYTALVPELDSQGKITGYKQIAIYESVPLNPWWVGTNPLTIPKQEEGWFLLNEYLNDDQQGYFAITYYNEQRGRLRIYLYDHNLSQKHTGFNVRVSLLGQIKSGQYKELKGSIFPVHTNPFLWSSTTLPLQTLEDITNPTDGNLWSANKWGAVEMPFLIPMVENIPVGAPSPHVGKKNPMGKPYYHSVYDEPFKLNLRSVKLKIEICPFDEGKISGDFTGEATGKAIQEMKATGNDPITTVKDWLSKGKSFVEGAKKGWDKFVGWYTQEEDPNNKGNPKSAKSGDALTAFKTTAKIVSTGLSVFSGGLGAAGSIVDLAADLFNLKPKPQPLELSVKLGMEGMIQGSQLVQYTPRGIEFYLPGRFAIDEVIHNNEISILDQAKMDSVLPRYDRRLGLFGFMYNPADVTFRMQRLKEYHTPGTDYYAYIYPTKFQDNPKYVNIVKPGEMKWQNIPKQYADELDYLLPIIFNPYGEILPIKPTPVGNAKVALHDKSEFKYPSSTPLGLGQLDDNWWRRKTWTYDVSYQTHISNPELGDVLPSSPNNEEEAFYTRVTVYGNEEYDDRSTIYWYDWHTPMGHCLQAVPKPYLTPQIFDVFKQIVDVEHSDHILGSDMPGTKFGLPNSKYYAIPKWMGTHAEKSKYAPKHSAWPIYHVIYSSKLPYFYYGRTRQKFTGIVPKTYQSTMFNIPITMVIKERYTESNQFKWKQFTSRSDIGREPS